VSEGLCCDGVIDDGDGDGHALIVADR
jgi:hypothetical protein